MGFLVECEDLIKTMPRRQDTDRNPKRGWTISLVLIGVMLILPMKDSLSWAQENQGLPAQTETQAPKVNPETQANLQRSNALLNALKSEIGSNQDLLYSVNRQITESEDKLGTVQEKVGTLQEQLDNLNAQIGAAEEIINSVNFQINQKQSEIETLQYQVEQKKVEISNQKQMLTEYLKVMYKDQIDLNSFDGDQAYLNTVKLLLGSDTTGQKLRSIRYSEVLEAQGRDIFEKLGALIDEQETSQKISEVKKRTLTILYGNLAEQKTALEVKKTAKQNLLDETKGQEEIYQQLLDQTKANQEEVLQEMDTLRKNMEVVKAKMQELGNAFNPNDFATLLNVKKHSKLLDLMTMTDGNSIFAPIWPVTPDRGISAYFREASYVKIFGMQHNAVDIRAYQSTPIKAAADGVVYKAKDNGFGYSYIMLAHANGFMTLYGHVSDIMVSEGQEIKVGDIIGLSGATPGTKGAGVYTTGPHLHFEVLKNGEHVDPLDYLNLNYLTLASLPEKYLAKALVDIANSRVRVKRFKIRNKVNQPDQVMAANVTESSVTGDVATGAAVTNPAAVKFNPKPVQVRAAALQ